jgi:hypothetical protein
VFPWVFFLLSTSMRLAFLVSTYKWDHVVSYRSFCAWLISFNKMTPNSIHVLQIVLQIVGGMNGLKNELLSQAGASSRYMQANRRSWEQLAQDLERNVWTFGIGGRFGNQVYLGRIQVGKDHWSERKTQYVTRGVDIEKTAWFEEWEQALGLSIQDCGSFGQSFVMLMEVCWYSLAYLIGIVFSL